MTVVCIADSALLCSGEPVVLIEPGGSTGRCGGGGRSAGDGLALAPAVVRRFRHQGSEQNSSVKGAIAIPQKSE